eukprot:Lithocolla_globosa_v1_NODE_2_length_15149_cov_8.547436.p3 type:complete len:307 gc:universal NODE_2_length_15149_cov_8.547436:1106-186(-)
MDFWLNEKLSQQIFFFLDGFSILQLGSTCQQIHKLSQSQDIWHRLYCDDFGDLEYLQTLLVKVEIIKPEHLQFKHADWKQAYITKRKQPQMDVEKIENQYNQIQNRLERFGEIGATEDDLVKIVQQLIVIIEDVPEHVPSYYSLAYVCFFLNQFSTSLHFIDIGQQLAGDFLPLIQLRTDVEAKLDVLEGGEEDAPLVENDQLSPAFIQVLVAIFHKFDHDQDKALNLTELGAFVAFTNGEPLPRQTLKQMMASLPCNAKGHLTFEGFQRFFYLQTIDDPEETRSDLLKHGYDRQFNKIEQLPVAA